MIDIQYIRTSTLLLKWDGLVVLTDPWFAMHMRGLPVFVRPCVKAEELPLLDLVMVSHLHPDHFDRKAMSKLSTPCKLLVGPPGVEKGKDRFQAARIEVMTDGQVLTEQEFTVRAFSVEHSGYENAYLVERKDMSLFFAGDAKYCESFKRIGEQFSPTVSLLPVGGTEILGRRIVMNPEDALCAAKELGTKVVIPIHIGGEWMSVPPLSRHPGRAEQLVELAGDLEIQVVALKPGECATIDEKGRVTSHP